MAWYDEDSMLTWALGPYVTSIVATIIIAIFLPILVHYFLYRPKAPSSLPSFLIFGPSSSGKTALITHFEGRASSATHTSLEPVTIETRLPASTTPSSLRYRSANDFESRAPQRLLLTDTPGHSKIRSHAFAALQGRAAYTAIVFVVDAANLSAEKREDEAISGLSDAAGFLYDVLLQLQLQYSNAKSSKHKEVPVLIAANKMDLFTALPVSLVKSSLEAEITRERESRAKGLTQDGAEEEAELLGDEGQKFSFAAMSEHGVDITVLGGNVAGAEDPQTEKWWDWIAQQM